MDMSCSMDRRDKKCIQILARKPKGKGLLGRLGTDGRIILKWILQKQGVNLWTEFNWLRTGTTGRLLWTW
jgi:hypothetical protein